MSDSRPLISLLVPTGGRVAQLRFTLETILAQESRNFELLVSDNSMSDATEAVVRTFSDQRLRYIRTDRRLSMIDSYEFAVEHASGRFLMIIGDDDAIASGAIGRLESLVAETGQRILFWDSHIYRWPEGKESARLVYKAPRSKMRVVTLRDRVRFSFRWGGLRYMRLPLLYHSLVAREVLDAIRDRTGRLFHSTQPDVFLAFALPVFCPQALEVGESLTIYGGTELRRYSPTLGFDDSSFSERVRQFEKEQPDYELHASLYPGVPFWINMIPDAMLVARDLFPDYYRDCPFDYDAMWAFLRRYWRFGSAMSVIRRRREIRRYHPFHVSRFLFFTAASMLSDLRIAGRRALGIDPTIQRLPEQPTDIAALVRLLAALDRAGG